VEEEELVEVLVLVDEVPVQVLLDVLLLVLLDEADEEETEELVVEIELELEVWDDELEEPGTGGAGATYSQATPAV